MLLAMSDPHSGPFSVDNNRYEMLVQRLSEENFYE
jgi:hypothetical protein